MTVGRRKVRGVVAALLVATLAGGTVGATAVAASPAPGDGTTSSCQLGTPANPVSHVIYIQFDNVHLTRTNPNVPSDLEQMPHLLDFLTQYGVVLSNHHTPLIAHTATDILTSLTGVYGDRMGVPIANTFRYFNPNGTTNPAVSFAYWTDPIYDYSTSTPKDTTYNMLTADGKNAPAPWVPYTRAGCDVGAVATANTVLENIATDIPTVFGANSPQAQEVVSDPHKATADFVGIGVHCAAGASLCSTANGGVTDALPDEPGGYNGYQALFGASTTDPQIFEGGTPVDLAGNVIRDPAGNVGFPGFDGMSASVSLGYVAAMQEHGIPVTYAYISDAHDQHIPFATSDSFGAAAYGPGEAGYVAALKSYDDAFGTFFTRLASDGITPANTLFVITSDENDHFVGGPPRNPGCDGVNVPCLYDHQNCPSASISNCSPNNIGEINANMTALLAQQQGISSPFLVHADSAPNVYITGNPARTSATARAFEQATSRLTLTNPFTGATQTVTNYLADPVEEQILHMVTADPNRTPTFTLFANPDDYLYSAGPTCSYCVQQESAYAWNHGDAAPDVNTTWLGLAGPGVRQMGVDGSVWSDHTDIRPTMMALLGLTDDYSHDGRVLFEVMTPSAVPTGLRARPGLVEQFAQTYKQLDAAVGQFGLDTLAISTHAVASNSPGDATYTALENQLIAWGAQRDQLVSQMSADLEAAEFSGTPIPGSAATLMAHGRALLDQVAAAAGS